MICLIRRCIIFGNSVQSSPNSFLSNPTNNVVRASSRSRSLFESFSGDSNGSDMSGVENRMDQLIDVVGKGKPVNMDGRKVGVAVGMATHTL